MVILGIRAAVSGVWVWVRHNRVRDVGGIFWRNNNVLSGGDSIDRIRGVELSKGGALRGSAPLSLAPLCKAAKIEKSIKRKREGTIGMFNARNQVRWFEEEWRRNNEREVEKIEEPVVGKVSEPEAQGGLRGLPLREVEKIEEPVVGKVSEPEAQGGLRGLPLREVEKIEEPVVQVAAKVSEPVGAEVDEEAAKVAENHAKHLENLAKYFARTTESTTMAIPVHRQKATR